MHTDAPHADSNEPTKYSNEPTTDSEQHPSHAGRSEARRRALAFALVFAAALCVRLVCWQDARPLAGAVQSAVTENYRQQARLLVENGLAFFFTTRSKGKGPDL